MPPQLRALAGAGFFRDFSTFKFNKMNTYFFTLKIGSETRHMGFEAPDAGAARGLAEAWAEGEANGLNWTLYAE